MKFYKSKIHCLKYLGIFSRNNYFLEREKSSHHLVLSFYFKTTIGFPYKKNNSAQLNVSKSFDRRFAITSFTEVYSL